MSIITKTSGHFIINSCPISLSKGSVVSYRKDADVEEFSTEDEMLTAYRLRMPTGTDYTGDIDGT
jgi:hypothetical protein